MWVTHWYSIFIFGKWSHGASYIWPIASELIYHCSRWPVRPISHGKGVSNTTLACTTSDLLKESKQHWYLCNLSDTTQWTIESWWHTIIWKRVSTNFIALLTGSKWHLLSICLEMLHIVPNQQTVNMSPFKASSLFQNKQDVCDLF